MLIRTTGRAVGDRSLPRVQWVTFNVMNFHFFNIVIVLSCSEVCLCASYVPKKSKMVIASRPVRVALERERKPRASACRNHILVQTR